MVQFLPLRPIYSLTLKNRDLQTCLCDNAVSGFWRVGVDLTLRSGSVRALYMRLSFEGKHKYSHQRGWNCFRSASRRALIVHRPIDARFGVVAFRAISLAHHIDSIHFCGIVNALSGGAHHVVGAL